MHLSSLLALLLLPNLLLVCRGETVCYGDLGCFTTAPPWTSSVRPIPQLPEDPAVINTRFRLYTRTFNTTGFELETGNSLALFSSPFDGAKKSVFLIHGWTNSANSSWVRTSVSEILTLEDINVFTVDWSSGAGYPYLRAMANTLVVGAELQLFISFLTSLTAQTLSQVHLVGHNLGAHAASYTGSRLFGLGRITGLDPATIYFEGGDIATRLDPSDAVFVDVIHTDAPYTRHVGLGFASATGHVDVYPNNGQKQPGCTDTINQLVSSADELVQYTGLNGPIDSYVCSHMRSTEYFVESINSMCAFTAHPCSSFADFVAGLCYSPCRTGKCTSLGYHAAQYAGRGVFYSTTQPTEPYCDVLVRVEMDVSLSQSSTGGAVSYILIGDIGQTKEATLYDGSIVAGFIVGTVVTLPGSGPLRIGHVDSVRLKYERGLLQERELIIDRVIVQQSNITIEATDQVFNGAILTDGEYVTVYPKVN